MNAFSILTGVGRLYIAEAGTAPPDLGEAPDAEDWRDLGDTQDGVELDPSQKLELTRTDQRTGVVKAVRSEEELKCKTKLVENTLENLADFMGMSVTDTPPDVGEIGTRKMFTYRGANVAEYAFLFLGYSPYMDGPAYWYVPRGYFDLESIKYDKAKNAPIPISFNALEDLDASNANERHGYLIAQDAEATA